MALAMLGRLSLAGLAAAAALAAPAAAGTVSVQFDAFGPGTLDVLPGETVTWTNVSERRHTVAADDGSFFSGDLLAGDTYARTFDTVGVFAYHCTVHAGMVGEVDVRRVTLGPLPGAPVPAGERVDFSGRTSDTTAPVVVEQADGAGFRTLAQAAPAPDGTWSARAIVLHPGDVRARSGADTSESRPLLVSDRHVVVHATRRGVAVDVTPPLPYGHVVLQQLLRERFGWWPQRTARLDYLSKADIPVRRPARVRVALLAPDGVTPTVMSAIVVLHRPPRHRPGARGTRALIASRRRSGPTRRASRTTGDRRDHAP